MTIRSYCTRHVSAPSVLIVLLLCLGCNRIEEIPIVRVDVADTLHAGDSAQVVFGYPSSCYHSAFLMTDIADSTIRLVLMATRETGRLCLTSFEMDSFYTQIYPGRAGDYIVVYRRSAGMDTIPVMVTYPE